ncbi:MAG: electron transporter RnfC, partial [Erysipelotrichaceae bacterium]|nr:electron transporter RnfC [Erysipelotrichaceae bacterium]
MPFLIGPMHQHIDGRKELTAHNEILRPEAAKELRIALNHGNTEAKCLVEVDQEVRIGTKIAERSDFVYVPFFSPVSGKVVRIEKSPA